MPASVRIDDILSEVALTERALASLLQAGAEPAEVPVWELYERAERAAAFLKLRLGAESPGVFRELKKPDRGKRLELLKEALPLISDARAKMEKRDLLAGLASLRGAKDLLRAYLADLRRERLRLARAARKASSQAPSS